MADLPIDDDVRAELDDLQIDDDVRAELEALSAPQPTTNGNADVLAPARQLDDPSTPAPAGWDIDEPEPPPEPRTRLATAKAGPVGGAGPSDMGRVPQGEPLSPETKRMMLEIVGPMAASAFLGPEAGIGLRALTGMLSGAASSGAGELIAPSPDALTAAMRIGLNSIPFAEGLEVLPQVPRAMAKGALATGGAAALATGGDPSMTGMGMVPGGVLGGLGASARGQFLTRMSQEQVAKALGFVFSQLKQTGRDEARRVAQVAMDEGVVGRLTSPETMLGRAQNVQDEAGAALGALRDQMDRADPGASRSELTARIEGDLRDWVPGESHEPVYQGQLDAAINDVNQTARDGATRAPVVGPEGDRALWEMTRDEARAWGQQLPRSEPGHVIGTQDQVALLQQHRAEVASALVHGQPVPERVLAEYPDLVEALPPEYMNATTLARFKKIAADHAYNEARSLTPETLQGATSHRWETARAGAQQSEEELAERVLSQEANQAFLRGKDVYGAMERLTNPLAGATEARASRVLGNNQMFGLSNQLGGIMGAAAGPRGTAGGAAGLGFGSALTKALYEYGNQNIGLLARDLNRFLLAPETGLGVRLAPNLIRGLGLREPEQPADEPY